MPRLPAPLRRLALRRRSASLPVVLLGGVVGLAAVLGYQAWDAERSDRKRAEATLRDYATIGAEEFERRARTLVLPLLRLSLQAMPGAPGYDAAATAELPPERLRRLLLGQQPRVEEMFACDCLDGLRYAFVADLRSGAVAAVPMDSGRGQPPPAALTAWIDQTMRRQARVLTGELAQVPDADGRATAPSLRTRLALGRYTYGFHTGAPDGVPRLLAYVLLVDSTGTPRTAYGYESDPAPWLDPIFARVMQDDALLPPSLLRGITNDRVLAVHVLDPEGRLLFRSAARFDDAYAVVDTMAARYGSLRVHLAVFPEFADELLVGGLPRSRLPLLLALFALTTGLAVVALLQMRRQQELARLRTDFVSSVSHELRTPLAQIRWFAELLRMNRLRNAEERDRSLRIIDQEARRLAFLVENVLNFSRGGQHAGRVKPEATRLADEVREVVDSFLPLAQARRVRVELLTDERVHAVVAHAALRQILLNLLDNAVKYGPVGQVIQVGVEPGPAGTARLWVEDEGPGVPEEERERVWEPFYRAERDLGSPITGSGIGLSVVSDLVILQHGQRSIETGARGGARFVLDFPSPETPRPSDASSPHERLLGTAPAATD
ncbi:MAG TPA: HAMP domain-containing sensor histidine kinase [Gemmatimonadaceae bacterium]|nr:HAMP domain-containing sensor histidine kinase [Gemmatimonadaceae bacterium]